MIITPEDSEEKERDLAYADWKAQRVRLGIAKEQEECEHHELDHCVCLHCGKELDPGDVYGGAADRAQDFWEDR